jgi:hypothetical protein
VPLTEACKEGPCLKCSHWQALVFLSSPLWTRLHWHSLLADSAARRDEGSRRYARVMAGSSTGLPCSVCIKDLACFPAFASAQAQRLVENTVRTLLGRARENAGPPSFPGTGRMIVASRAPASARASSSELTPAGRWLPIAVPSVAAEGAAFGGSTTHGARAWGASTLARKACWTLLTARPPGAREAGSAARFYRGR